jgi:hypothetical protein
MADYSNSMVYKLYCKDVNINEFYIGSTKNFIHRKRNHKNSCINPRSKNYNLKLYKYIRDNLGWDKWCFTTLEQISCDSKEQLLEYERKWYDNLHPSLNTFHPNRKVAEYQKIWYSANKERKKQYVEKNKNKIQEYQKNYRDENIDLIKKRKKIYYNKNKANNVKQNVTCNRCESSVSIVWFPKHQLTWNCVNSDL